MFDQQLVNHANAGKDFKVKASLLQNSQLTEINSSPKLGELHFSSPIGLTEGSLGFNATSFSLDVQSNTEVTAMYAYRMSFKKSTLVFGTYGTAVNVSTDNNKLTTSSEGDDRIKSPISGYGYNGGIGAYLHTENTLSLIQI